MEEKIIQVVILSETKNPSRMRVLTFAESNSASSEILHFVQDDNNITNE